MKASSRVVGYRPSLLICMNVLKLLQRRKNWEKMNCGKWFFFSDFLFFSFLFPFVFIVMPLGRNYIQSFPLFKKDDNFNFTTSLTTLELHFFNNSNLHESLNNSEVRRLAMHEYRNPVCHNHCAVYRVISMLCRY